MNDVKPKILEFSIGSFFSGYRKIAWVDSISYSTVKKIKWPKCRDCYSAICKDCFSKIRFHFHKRLHRFYANDPPQNPDNWFKYGNSPFSKKHFEKISQDALYPNYLPYLLDHPVGILPRKKVWLDFWKEMDRLDIWNWQKSYRQIEPQDGLFWELKIKREGRRHRRIVGGQERYPKGFNQFVKIMEGLAYTQLWQS